MSPFVSVEEAIKQIKKGKQNGGAFPQWFSSDMMDESTNFTFDVPSFFL